MSARGGTELSERDASTGVRQAKRLSMLLRQPQGYGLAAVVVAIVIAASLGPGFLSENNLNLATTFFILIVIGQAWNLIGGYAGQFSLGQAMFVGVGMYTGGLIVFHSSIPLEWAVVLSGLMAAAIGAIFAVPVLRLRGVSFSVGTLALALAMQAWMVVWGFGGKTIGINLPTLYVPLKTQYYVGLVVAIVATVAIAVIPKTTFGLRLLSVRDDEDAAKQVGVNTFAAKFWAFVVSALLTGIAGALMMIHNLHIEPRGAFDFNIAITAIVACVIGGLSSAPGPVIGTLIVFAIRQTFQTYGEYDKVILGVAMLVVILVAPDGIWGLLRQGGAAILARPRRIVGGASPPEHGGDGVQSTSTGPRN